MATTKQQEIRTKLQARLRVRYARERRFRAYGLAAVLFGLVFLAVFFVSIVSKGASAFRQSMLSVPVIVDASLVDPIADGTRASLQDGDYDGVIRNALVALFPDATSRRARRELMALVSSEGSFMLRDRVVADPSLLGEVLNLNIPTSANVDMLMKGRIDRSLPELQRVVSDRQLAWIDQLVADDRLSTSFSRAFFANGDSADAELAGIRSAVMGSFFMLLVMIAIAFPVGLAAAIYLEEFAPRNRWTDLIEVNINNLAAVPSIVYGLLGLAVFINWVGLPRSAPLVGGFVLALLTLPVIIITSRAAIKSVPPSIREAALGVGASRIQTVFQHVLPLALPGILTGTIIGMARALGESAPLLMIGMVAFIVDVPGSFVEPATALPVQVYLWADSPERAFVERTSAAIIVLLGFLLFMNLLAVILRRRFERKW
ncbi:MAG: phosphate ABC transporter permease PstA [Pseudomonadota bacterium]